MGRYPRINLAGLTYHVWANATSGSVLFRDHDDKDVAVRLLAEEARLSAWTCLAYVIMSTHYHVLVRLQEPTLSSGFQRLNLRYARYYNARYRRRGHAFEQPFQSKLVNGAAHELELSRYIARNPVLANMCAEPEDYQWSSYAATIGLYAHDPVIDKKAALAPLGGSAAAYRAFVEQTDGRKRLDLIRVRSLKEARQLPPGEGRSRR